MKVEYYNIIETKRAFARIDVYINQFCGIIREGCTERENCKELLSFDNEPEALKALNNYKTSVNFVHDWILVTEFAVEHHTTAYVPGKCIDGEYHIIKRTEFPQKIAIDGNDYVWKDGCWANVNDIQIQPEDNSYAVYLQGYNSALYFDSRDGIETIEEAVDFALDRGNDYRADFCRGKYKIRVDIKDYGNDISIWDGVDLHTFQGREYLTEYLREEL